MDVPQTEVVAGFPELTDLGKRLEMFRIGRGLSKQQLAKSAGTSRQQLWRVMTGKSELTAPLKLRLADVLHVSAHELEQGTTGALTRSVASGGTTRPRPMLTKSGARTLREFLDSPPAIARTLATLPDGRDGRVLKRRFLDCLEDLALSSGRPLDHDFFELRRRVLAGEL